MKHQETLFHERKLSETHYVSPIAQPLRPLTEPERQELQRVSRAPSETVSRHQPAMALLAVADGMSLI